MVFSLHRGPQFNPTPPLSSARTSVWYWELDGVPTTVMLTKESSEVWCNGQILDTIVSEVMVISSVLVADHLYVNSLYQTFFFQFLQWGR